MVPAARIIADRRVLVSVLAVLATWAQPSVIIHHGWIVIAMALGFAVGWPLSRVPLTAVPQRTALSHAFGGLAAGLVGTDTITLTRTDGDAPTVSLVTPTTGGAYATTLRTLALSGTSADAGGIGGSRSGAQARETTACPLRRCAAPTRPRRAGGR